MFEQSSEGRQIVEIRRVHNLSLHGVRPPPPSPRREREIGTKSVLKNRTKLVPLVEAVKNKYRLRPRAN